MNKTALRMEDSHAGPVCILSIGGRIDSGNAADLLDRLNKLISSGEKTILLDLKEVLYLTSAAFRVLLVATGAAEVAHYGGTVRRGVARRDVTSACGSSPRYAKPGTKPRKCTSSCRCSR